MLKKINRKKFKWSAKKFEMLEDQDAIYSDMSVEFQRIQLKLRKQNKSIVKKGVV